MYAGLRQPDGVQGLIVEAAAEAVPSDIDLPRSRGFSLDAQLAGPSHGGKVRFTLALIDPAYQNVFAVLCDNVAEAAAAAPTSRAGLREWLRQLLVWQEFMARYGPGGLSDEAALGLVGELLMLRDELAPRLGYAAAIVSWAGPRGEPNDFEFAGGFLEIKTTSRQAPDAFRIANLDQLDDRRGPILIACVRLRADQSGMTLPSLVSDLRRRLSGVSSQSAADFDARLMAAGFVDIHAPLYPTAWVVTRIDFYQVREGFPRLTRRDVPSGVQSCSYSVTIADCAPYLSAGTSLDQVIGTSLDG